MKKRLYKDDNSLTNEGLDFRNDVGMILKALVSRMVLNGYCVRDLFHVISHAAISVEADVAIDERLK
jgi:hypothetical protein